MVVLAKGDLEQIALPEAQKAPSPLADVPEIDLAAAGHGAAGRAAAARAVVAACEEHGFFKVTGHGMPAALLARVEAAAAAFFALPQREKEAAAPGSAFGYASKRIGSNGDLGWVEYLLLGVTAASAAPLELTGAPLPVSGEVPPASPCSFRDLLNEYIVAVRRMTCEVLELITEGLGIEENDVFTGLVLDKESDSMLRVNHYPPRPELNQLGHGRFIGFGEHTDPQIISVLRSNNTSGLEISLRDGSWVSVPPDHNSFFVNVGDALQADFLCSQVNQGSDEREVPEREAQGDGEQRPVAVVGDLLRRPGSAGEAGAAAVAGGGRRAQPVQGVHLEGVQGLGVPDQARGEQALPLRDHELARACFQVFEICRDFVCGFCFASVFVVSGVCTYIKD